MTEITAVIAGRQFRLACEDGQEEQLQTLAQELDARIDELRQRFGEIGDTRLTVMAALTAADEVREAQAQVHRLQENLARLQDGRVASTERARAASAAVVHAFNSAAERIEGITKRLNQTVGDSEVIG
ncbi:MAG TPA: cell division protein ZapA [Pseudolabrys sp.]|nr:cell division protein ZapA [Pseudolabrys sp.]